MRLSFVRYENCIYDENIHQILFQIRYNMRNSHTKKSYILYSVAKSFSIDFK